MRAVVIREHGSYDKLVLEDLPVPEPGPGEVRVRVRAAALNHLDTWVRRGIEGFRFPLPITPGCDGAGVVDALGDGVDGIEVGMETSLAPGLGDHMARDYGILGETRDGTCAELIVVPAENVLPKPDNVTFEQAAAVPLTFLTAWGMLVRRAQVREGEWVLIQAGGSGVGVACIQIAKMFCCKVIVTASTQEKRDKARELGADEALEYKNLAREVRAITNKAGVNVVVDHLGPDTWEASVACMAKGGRLVTCGGTTGYEIRFDLRHLFFKSLSFLGSTMGSLEETRTVLEHVQAGRLHPVIDSVFPLERIGDAHRRLTERAVFGKIVVTL